MQTEFQMNIATAIELTDKVWILPNDLPFTVNIQLAIWNQGSKVLLFYRWECISIRARPGMPTRNERLWKELFSHFATEADSQRFIKYWYYMIYRPYQSLNSSDQLAE